MRPHELLEYDDIDVLQSDHYLITNRDSKKYHTINVIYGINMEYVNVALLLCDGLINPRYVGVTHEYFDHDNDQETRPVTYRAIKIKCHPNSDENNDSFYRSRNKYQQDIGLFLQGLEDEPDNPRYMFYLAQSYYDTCDYYSANYWYQKRYMDHMNQINIQEHVKSLQIFSWWEETYIGLVRIYMCSTKLDKNYETCVKPLYQAINLRSDRLEAYYYLIQYEKVIS
jgi:hypothetical protein